MFIEYEERRIAELEELIKKKQDAVDGLKYGVWGGYFMKYTSATLARRQMLIGRAKKMMDAGRSWKDICQALGLTESAMRSIRHVINEAEIKKM